MARKSDNQIRKGDDWSLDTRNGLPYSGASVQSFIKQQFDSKVGAGFFDASDMALYLFKDEESKDAFELDRSRVDLLVGTIPLSFETTQYRIRITPSGSTNVNASVNANTIDLEMALQAERRELGEPSWEPTNQDIGVRVYIDARNTGNYEEIPQLAQVVLATSGNLSVDVRQYLPVGVSKIRFYFYAIDNPTLTSSLVWTITLAEMYIEEWGNTWNRPLIENMYDGYYHLGGFKIIGTIAKILHIEILNALSVVAYYERDLGPTETTETSYMFTRNEGLDLQHPENEFGESLPALSTGIYNVRVWLTSGNLSTEDNAIVYNIMYIAPGDEYTARLVIMNYSGRDVNNYDESAHLCDYAIYNAGQTYGTPTAVITPYIDGTPQSPTTKATEIETGKKYELRHGINLVTSSKLLTISYRISMTDNYQEGVSRVNNDEIFPPAVGASFYLNTSLRENGERETREIVYNTANNSQVALASVEWSGMSWVDGIDGWDYDDNGRKCLFLPARTRLTIPNSSYNFFPSDGITIELCYKVVNVSDYNENIITISQNPESDNFHGLRIKPTNITVHSNSDASSANDIYQGTNVSDEEVIHLILSIQRNFGEQGDQFNLVTGYVNGVRNFQFSYPANTVWSNNFANAVFGSDTADLYLYMVRAYSQKAISSSDAEKNWLNSLVTLDEKTSRKQFMDSVLNSSSRQISYDKIKNDGDYNFFVIEMTSGSQGVPSTSYPDGGRSNIEMHYGKDENGNSLSAWDWKIYDVETKGQGTTSMNYWLWNIRWRIDKTDDTKERNVAYFGTPVISGGERTFVELPSSSSKTVWFDGNGNHPAVKRITAKINFASSMQSHKMGATRAYTLLHDSLLEGAMKNEAQRYATTSHSPMPTVAVYQYPAYGFQKTIDSLGRANYTFIGLFTIGPDKGDKATFGYDLVAEGDLVTLEGVDHTPQMTKFNVPWDEQTVYNVNNDGDGFIATKAPSGNYQNAVEVGNAGAADTKKPNEAMPVLETYFKPAYEVVYNNSTLIFPVALNDPTWGGANASAVLQNINSNIGVFRGTSYNERLSYEDMEFWIEGEYNLYHFEYETEVYVSGKKVNGSYGSPLNLLTDTGISSSELNGLTLDEQNDLFKNARRTRFLANAPLYWDMNELAFNYVFLLVFGATDNFAKNQYPYYMGQKWRFRQDDLDTIEDIDNNGGQTKPAYIEFGDTVNGSPYFAGSNSVLWNLVNESMWTDGASYSGIRSMGCQMLEVMSTSSSGNNMYDGFIKFFDKYFWGRAQGYFPPSAYNIDGNTKYEAAWLTGRSFSVNPLRQSLGDHLSAERLWVRNRAVYCMSLFGAGAFGTYEHEYLGRITFRPVVTERFNSLTITPAISMYPCLIIGDNDVRPTGRTMEGDSYEFTSLSGDGNTTYSLQAVNYITSFGDLKNLTLGQQEGGIINISGKKLRNLKFGDATEEVTTNVSTIVIDPVNGLPCLEVIDVRNASEMSGTLDLTKCKRVREVYTEGTSVSAVSLPKGSKIERLHLSGDVTSLSYQVIKYLYDLVLPEDPSNIILIYLEECNALDGMSTLEQIYKTTGQSLQYIRLLWDTEKRATGPQIRMLAHIMQNIDKNGTAHPYNGVDNTGSGSTAINPHLEGHLLATSFYQSDMDLLANGSVPVDSVDHPGMKTIQASYFGPLYITYSLEDEYIVFADEDVVDALYEAGIGDEIGLPHSVAEALDSIGTALTGKTNISSFDEFRYFTSVTALEDGTSSSGGAFRNCTALESITIPENVTSIGAYSFSGCSSLSEITFLGSSITTGSNAFNGCSGITKVNVSDIDAYLTYVWNVTFGHPNSGKSSGTSSLYENNVKVTSVTFPAGKTAVPNYCLYRFDSITSVVVPSGYVTLGTNSFAHMSNLSSVTLPSTITSVGSYAFYSCKQLSSITIPEGCTTINQYAFAESSITSISLPSTLVTLGDNAFNNCTSLANLTIPSGVSTVTPSMILYCGVGGTVTIGGDFICQGTSTSPRYRGTNLIVGGNLTNSGTYNVMHGVYPKSLRVGGNLYLSTASTMVGLVDAGNGNNSSFEFLEVMGTITGYHILNTNSTRYIRTGTVLHLGYNGMACTADQAVASNGSIDVIYIGPGESEAGDQAIIDTYYLTDPSWASVSGKLRTWYSYNGTYKNQ